MNAKMIALSMLAGSASSSVDSAPIVSAPSVNYAEFLEFAQGDREEQILAIQGFLTFLESKGSKHLETIQKHAAHGVLLEQCRLVARSVLDPNFADLPDYSHRIGAVPYIPGSAGIGSVERKMKKDLKSRIRVEKRDALECEAKAVALAEAANDEDLDEQEKKDMLQDAVLLQGKAKRHWQEADRIQKSLEKTDKTGLVEKYEKLGDEGISTTVVGMDKGSFGKEGITMPTKKVSPV